MYFVFIINVTLIVDATVSVSSLSIRFMLSQPGKNTNLCANVKVGFKHPFALKRAGVVGQLLIKHSHFNVHLNIVYWQRCIIKSDKKSWFESSKVFMRGGHPHIIWRCVGRTG